MPITKQIAAHHKFSNNISPPTINNELDLMLLTTNITNPLNAKVSAKAINAPINIVSIASKYEMFKIYYCLSQDNASSHKILYYRLCLSLRCFLECQSLELQRTI